MQAHFIHLEAASGDEAATKYLPRNTVSPCLSHLVSHTHARKGLLYDAGGPWSGVSDLSKQKTSSSTVSSRASAPSPGDRCGVRSDHAHPPTPGLRLWS